MDIQETDEGSGITSVHNTEGERTSNPPPNIQPTSTHEDRTDGEMEALGTYTNDLESKATLGRRQSIDNNSDGDTQKDEASITAPLTNTIQPKKTKEGT